ncbi:MAG: ATP-binding protein [Desulfococcaceae bacterium]|jgi:signal transduction histidine kinase/DNA-binding NarL/FixJ family response regulator|nr:ATP-binding protein [Desulfococcaceae bacterium]
MKAIYQCWKNVSISAKFFYCFGILLFLILFLSLSAYGSLTYIRYKIESVIFNSTEIRRMVLEMNGNLQNARRMEREFFLRYPTMGFSHAFRMYFAPTEQQIAEVVKLSSELQKKIAASEVSDALRESDMNLNLYLSASDHYALIFREAVSLVETLASEEKGLQVLLENYAGKIAESPEIVNNSLLFLTYMKMQSLEKDYLLTRQRPFMQSALNAAFVLEKDLKEEEHISEKRKQQICAYLAGFRQTAEQILRTDVKIRSKIRESDLQAEALEPVARELMELARREVEHARGKMGRIYRWIVFVLLSAAVTGLLLTLMTAAVLNRSITRNIILLTAGAEAIRNGDTEKKVRIDTRDELGRLALTFNEMGTRIHTLIHHLEQKVRERTAELRIMNEELQVEIRERKEAEKALKTAKEEAEKANRIKSEFLANMSHEIRTPMNAILGFTDILDRLLTDPQQKEYLAAVNSSGKALLRLINDILDLSKVEAGKMEIFYNPVYLHQVFRETAALFCQEVRRKKLNFILETDPDLPRRVLLDETRLRQILFNLLGNAVKYTVKGSVTMSVRVEKDRDKDAEKDLGEEKRVRLIIEIRDTGIGIPEDEQEYIFDMFAQSRGKCRRNYEGTGLGLPISRKLLEMMNGKLDVKSQDGRGSVFRAVLSSVLVIPDREKSREYPFADPDAGAGERDIVFEAACVLLADDIEYNRKLIMGYLKDFPLEMIEAENGKEALVLAEKHRPDIILMDMKMPLMGGYEAAERIRNHPELSAVPIIAVTASAMKDSEKRIREVCNAYLCKPLHRDDLIREMRRFLPHRIRGPFLQADTCHSLFPPPLTEKTEAENMQNCGELKEILRENIRGKWLALRETMFIDGIEDFARQIRSLGKEYASPPLDIWAGRLLSHTGTFDIEKISETMETFSQFLEEAEQ